jgi:hypothetical protein
MKKARDLFFYKQHPAANVFDVYYSLESEEYCFAMPITAKTEAPILLDMINVLFGENYKIQRNKWGAPEYFVDVNRRIWVDICWATLTTSYLVFTPHADGWLLCAEKLSEKSFNEKWFKAEPDKAPSFLLKALSCFSRRTSDMVKKEKEFAKYVKRFEEYKK